MSNVVPVRPIDQKRLDALYERRTSDRKSDDVGYIHTVLAQCFLPYRDPKTDRWNRTNGNYGISLIAGSVQDPHSPDGWRNVGLPYGAKPRLFQTYISTQAVKNQSPVIPVDQSMSGMMLELGIATSGGKKGNVRLFKDQTTRFAACKFTIAGPGPTDVQKHIHAEPFRSFDVWFPSDPNQRTLWPSEIVLTEDYYDSLKDHAVPFDFRALKPIQNKPRAMDIYLWMVQRLCRINEKYLFMDWKNLYGQFGGKSPLKQFKYCFADDLNAARASYPDARLEPDAKGEGYRFFHSPPPIPKTKISVIKPHE